MKVKELRDQLSKLDPELDVLCYCEDEKFLTGRKGFVLFYITDVDTAMGERMRLDDDTPYMKFERSPEAVTVATLNVTADF